MTAPALPPVKPAPTDEPKLKTSVFATMTRDEGRTLFNQMEENRMHREGFGI